MKRPVQKRIRMPLSVAERRDLAVRARYVGSAEHKVHRWWGGMPMARQLPGGQIGRRGQQTTTVCPLTKEEDRTQATEWVRKAILAGQYQFVEADQDFPKEGMVRSSRPRLVRLLRQSVGRGVQGLAD